MINSKDENDIANPDDSIKTKQEAGDLTSSVVITIDADLNDKERDENEHLLMTNNGNIKKRAGKVVLTLDNVAYKIVEPNSRRCCGRKNDRKILQNIK